jgi:hypothetical protein
MAPIQNITPQHEQRGRKLKQAGAPAIIAWEIRSSISKTP